MKITADGQCLDLPSEYEENIKRIQEHVDGMRTALVLSKSITHAIKEKTGLPDWACLPKKDGTAWTEDSLIWTFERNLGRWGSPKLIHVSLRILYCLDKTRADTVVYSWINDPNGVRTENTATLEYAERDRREGKKDSYWIKEASRLPPVNEGKGQVRFAAALPAELFQTIIETRPLEQGGSKFFLHKHLKDGDFLNEDGSLKPGVKGLDERR